MVMRERRHQQPLNLPLPLPPPVTEPHYQFPSPPVISPNSPSTIDTLADLEKLSVLGHGTGGTVYKVRHLPTSSIFALKVLRLSGTTDARRRSLREAEILHRLDSPRIVKCHGILDGGGGNDVCFVMEYLKAGSLQDLLRRRRRLPEPVIAGVVRSLLEGLGYLHGMRIVHRDIKPSNLLIGERGEVKIADFGLSRVVVEEEEEEEGGTCEGTWGYMSPERFDSEGFGWGGGEGGGYAGDVWGVGVVALECWVGEYPLVGEGERADWAALMCIICYGDAAEEVGEAASPEFRSFVGRCLEKDWRRRGTVGELLNHPFLNNCSSSLECLVDGGSFHN